MRRRSTFLVGLLMALALVAAACGGSDSSDSDTTGTDNGGGGDTEVTVQDGGSARVVQPFDASSLDPTAIINSPSQGSAALNAIYDVLFTVDGDGTFNEHIATDFSTPDGITWTLTLRDGVMFTDGTQLDADAVMQQWALIKDTIRSSSWSYMADVESMNVVDPLTLEVVLSAPNYQFHQAAQWGSMVWIPSPTAVAAAGEDFGNQPVGAGPFQLVSRTPGSETVLERNPDYWQEGLPKLDQITFTTILDPQQAYDTIATGAAQAEVNTPDQFAVQARDAGMNTIGTDGVGGAGWLLGSDNEPFDDIRAREAIYLALDMEQLNDVLYDGAAEVPRSFFMESSPFYNADITFPEPDPVRAQELLDELADEGNPVSFTIITPGGNSGQQAVQLQTQLSAFDNLNVSVETLDGATYGVTLYSGDFDLAVYGMGGVDPEPVVSSMRTTHPIPIASMDSAAIDEAVAEGRSTDDLEARKAAYDTVTTEMNELFRMVFMNRNYVWAIENGAAGIETYGQGSPLWAEFGLTG